MKGKRTILWQAHEANISGANIAMLEYANALKDDYNFLFVLPHSGSMEGMLASQGFASCIVPQYGWGVSNGKLPAGRLRIRIRSILAVWKIRSLIKKHKIALVFTNTQIPFAAARAAMLARKPHVWWIHEYGEEDFGFKAGFGDMSKAAQLMRRSKLIICNSDAVSSKFKSLIPDADIITLYQPVTVKGSLINEGSAAPKRFLMFGQIVRSKGHLMFLKALASSGRKDLYVAIKGPSEDQAYFQELSAFIKSNNVEEQVSLEKGFFEKEEAMSCFDALVCASDAEAFGRVIVEANKLGLRAIVRNSGGAPELINDTNGLLFNDLNELTAILKGEKKMPEGEIKLSYNEQDEILKLKSRLDNL